MDNQSFIKRAHLVGLIFGFLALATVLRLFYLQVFKHSHYQSLATSSQSRKFEVHPERGNIYMYDRGVPTPVVLNKTLKRIYADPRFIENPDKTAKALATVLKRPTLELLPKLRSETFYEVLADRLESDKAKEVDELELAGIGIQDQPTRVYPEENLAAQALGFVNQEGLGQYGVEESYEKALSGQIGILNATTDTRGIPIATSDNFRVPPRAGSDLVLTLERNIQSKVEEILKFNMTKYSAKRASALVLDPTTGAVLAMANYPSFKPAEFGKVSDYSVFQNTAITGLYEPGSVIKAFTMAKGLESGAVTPQTTYTDTGSVRVSDRIIKNATGIPTGVHTMQEVIVKSINTGVVFVLSQLGGGTINETAKNSLFDFFVNKFRFGKPTGIDLPGEASGTINPPSTSAVNYANMSFGQGMSANMLQVASGFCALLNGGTYYQPYVVDKVINNQGSVEKHVPKKLATGLVSDETAKKIKSMLEGVIKDTGDAFIPGYHFGGKSGTAQIPSPDGGYYTNRDIGSFVGLAPLEDPKFLVMVRIDEPQIGTFASAAARPMAGEIMKWLIKYQGVQPSS